MKALNKKQLQSVINCYTQAKRNYNILKKGSTTYIDVFTENNKIVRRRVENDSSFNNNFHTHVGIIRRVQNEILKNINQKAMIDLVVPKDNYGEYERFFDREMFDKLENEELFYEFDIEKGYLQAALKLGYISQLFYSKFDTYFSQSQKQALREAITWFSRTATKDYYVEGKPSHTIQCNHTASRNIHHNIRNFLFNTMLQIRHQINYQYIKYNIDAIIVPKEFKTQTSQAFKELNLQYYITPCYKIDENSYEKQNQIINIKKPVKPTKTTKL